MLAALVTGGSGAIGAACAKRLLQEGFGVAIAGLHRERVDAAVESLGSTGRVLGVVCDTADPAAVDELVGRTAERFGGLDVLVASAGVYVDRTIEETDEATWRQVIDVNLSGAFWTIRAALPHLRRRAGYAVVIGSISGATGYAMEAAYGASKSALRTLIETVRKEGQADGVRATLISPGAVRTRMAAAAFHSDAFGPIGDEPGLLVPEDIAETVAYLLSLSPSAVIHEIVLRDSRGVVPTSAG